MARTIPSGVCAGKRHISKDSFVGFICFLIRTPRKNATGALVSLYLKAWRAQTKTSLHAAKYAAGCYDFGYWGITIRTGHIPVFFICEMFIVPLPLACLISGKRDSLPFVCGRSFHRARPLHIFPLLHSRSSPCRCHYST